MRILLIEDEAPLAKKIARTLRGQGHTVRLADDGKTALRLLKERVYDVAIVDLILPKLSGVQLLREIHHGKCKAKPTVIVITAHPSELPVPDPEHYGVACEVLIKSKNLTPSRLKKALVYCEELLKERRDRERGEKMCEKLIAEGKFEPEEGQIAVVNIEKEEYRIFRDEHKAIAYAKRRGGKRPYLRYFDSKLYGTLRRVQR